MGGYNHKVKLSEWCLERSTQRERAQTKILSFSPYKKFVEKLIGT